MIWSSAKSVRNLWFPGLVALVGVLVSLVAWGLLIADRRAQVLASTRETAAETREAIEVALGQQVDTLRGLRELWGTFGLGSAAEWTANVDERVDRVAGLVSVAWVDLDEPRNRTSMGKKNAEREPQLDAEAARLHREHPHVEGPELDASGGVQYRVFLPVHTPDESAGVLVAHFHVEPLLDAVLRARAHGYAVAVFWKDQEVYSRGAPSVDPWQRWWRIEETVALPLGIQWRVVHRPTLELAAARLTPLPHYLLIAGVLLSVVLAILAHQLRIIARQARFLEASNRALEQRGVELESRVEERTEALREAISELEAFNYSVSHDLRSPLGAILNFTAILEEDYREEPLDAEGLAILARIRRSASRATELLEGLLQLSSAGRVALTLEPVNMSALAHETFAQVRAAEDDPDVEFVVRPLPEIVGDRALLGNVFANLLSNALKYSRSQEKRRITVSGQSDGTECIYEVADNGQGFDMRFADKMFGVFERLHKDDEVEGAGVGLALVARIVTRHGGRVWVEGSPGEGARFSFSLPIRRPS